MPDTLSRYEARADGLFADCPVALWEEDLSALDAEFHRLRESGVTDLGAYLTQRPEEALRLAGLVRIVAVNRAALDLYEAPDQASLIAGLAAVFTEESLATFREFVIALFRGERRFAAEAVNRTLHGRLLRVNLKWALLPDDAGKPTRLLLSTEDVTERRKAEQELRESRQLFQTVVEAAPT